MVSVGLILQARNRRLSYIFYSFHIYDPDGIDLLCIISSHLYKFRTKHRTQLPLILKENARDGSSAKGSIAPDGKGKGVPPCRGGQRKIKQTQAVMYMGRARPVIGLELILMM